MKDLTSSPGVISEAKKQFCDVSDIMEYLGCRQNKAYAIIRSLRKELFDAGKLTPQYPPGKVPRRYFFERCMIEEEEE